MNGEYMVVIAGLIFLSGIIACILMIDDKKPANTKHETTGC